MRFMVLHKNTPEMERGLPTDPALFAAVGKFIEQAREQKIFVSGQGLHPTSKRVHVVYRDGKRTITDGPFTEAKELVAGFALMRVQSKEEAIAWCDKFAALIGDVELFMGPVVEPWDIGLGQKPANAPLRYLSMHKMDARAENDTPPDANDMARMGVLIDEMVKAGVMEDTGGLASTKKGARIFFDGGKRTVIDGPFAESKEYVAGYAIIEVPSKAAAIEWATGFGKVTKVHEVEVRQIPEW